MPGRLFAALRFLVNLQNYFAALEARVEGLRLDGVPRGQRARPYYPLSDNWALTQLSTAQPFFVDRRSRDLTPWIVLGGYWEHFVDNLLCALVRPGDCVVDVGANLGYYTVKLGGLVGPEGRVFAFEPNPQLVPFVRENIDINGLAGRTILIEAAAGAKAGKIALAFDPAHPGGGTVQTPGLCRPPGGDYVEVAVVRVDDSLPADISVDLVKIDVEGCEPLVLEGMAGVLGRSPDAVLVTEFSYLAWSRHGDPVQLLERFATGRRIFRIVHEGAPEELNAAAVRDLPPDLIAYFLLLPRSAERGRQMQAYLARFGDAPLPV